MLRELVHSRPRSAAHRRIGPPTSGLVSVERLEARTLLSGVAVNPTTTISLQDGLDGYSGTTDAAIRANRPNVNFGEATRLEAYGSPDKASLIRWDLSSVPDDAVLQSASITLDVSNPTADTYNLFAVLQPWTEGEVTWRHASAGTEWGTPGVQGAGDRGSSPLGTITASAAGTVTIDLNADGIALLQSWIGSPSTNNGLVIQDYSATDNLHVRSSETTNVQSRPKLTLTYTTGLTTVSFQDGVNGYDGTTDTTILSRNPTRNYGDASGLQAHGAPDKASLIRWDVSSIDPNAVVQSASITVRVANGSDQAYELYALLRPWVEDQTTWRQAVSGSDWDVAGAQGTGDRGSTALASFTAPAPGLFTINLNAEGIAQVQSWINDPTSNNGIILQDLENSDRLNLKSSEASNPSARPKLTITLVNDTRQKLEELVDGLERYHAAFAEFPLDEVPEFRAADGSPLLSWQVHLLPFIGYGELYQQFHLDEAWDSPHNLTLLEQMPDVFRSRGLAEGTNLTGFRMLQGNGAFEYGNAIDSALDGWEHTLLVIETLPQNADFWTRPDEIPFDPVDPLAALALPNDSFLVATPGFEIKEINPAVAAETFAAFATWDGGEVLSASQYQDLYVNWDVADDAAASIVKLEGLTQALAYYYDVYLKYPPGHEVPADWIDPATGTPYLSWRVHLLPFLGYTDLYEQFRFDEPYDSPHNIQLLNKMPEEFRSRGLTPGGTTSAFKFITGEGAYEVQDIPGQEEWRGPSRTELEDGASTTIQIVELTPDKAVPWTQWNEIEYSAADPLDGIGPVPSDGLRVTTWNGAIHTINPSATAANIGLFATWNGDEVFGPAESSNAFLDWALPDTVENRATKLRQVGLSLHNYHDAFRHFPVGGSADYWDTAAEHPNLSWRVHILPYLGYQDLYDQFHLDEAWDSPHNLQLLDKMPEVFRTRGLAADSHLTGLQFFIGPEAYEYNTSSADPNNWQGPAFRDNGDSSNNTILAIELLPENAIEWTRPDDVAFDPANPLAGVGTIPTEGLLALMVDGGVRTINPEVTPENFKTFVTWNGEELFGHAETSNVFLDWQQRSPGVAESPLGDEWAQNRNKLKFLGFALHNYHDAHLNFPISKDPENWDLEASTETNGVPNLSWRVHILPYLGYGDLYSEFRLDEAWDSPHNIQLLDKMPEVFRSRGLPADSTKTGFQVFMGDGAYEYEPDNIAYSGPRVRDIKDGTANTIAVIETLPPDAVEWTRPDGDITWNPADPLGSLTLPADYLLALMFDGSVSTFNPNVDAQQFAAYITLDGGEAITYRPDE